MKNKIPRRSCTPRSHQLANYQLIIVKFNSDWNWQKEKYWKNVLEKESYGATGVIVVIGIVKKHLF